MNTTKLLEEHTQLIRDYAQIALRKLKKPTISNVDDLIQEGVIAFLNASDDYDKDRGASFKTFLITCLKRHFTDLISRSYRKKEVANSVHIDNHVSKNQKTAQNTLDIVQTQFLIESLTEDEIMYVSAVISLADKFRRSRRKLARESLGISYEREMELRRSISDKIRK
jgi:RNA polymerase sigma factor (sigma-70 family)